MHRLLFMTNDVPHILCNMDDRRFVDRSAIWFNWYTSSCEMFNCEWSIVIMKHWLRTKFY